MLAELDGAKANERHVFLLAATNYRERVDPAIRDRFTYEIEIPKPDVAQKQRLFKIFLGKQPVDFDLNQVSAELAESSGEVGGREIQNIVKRAEQHAIERAFAATPHKGSSSSVKTCLGTTLRNESAARYRSNSDRNVHAHALLA
jgi:AAA+ superfamily predicted ATPase